ncbi:MAG: YqeY family protein [Candidatus Woesebacteria bacterium GW2011_GWB1_45_5]|uniref:YqeY family protein n=1 Tax=Candidatus Woesebacteria bacterium GW2011_GWB1_45_5 TaxID=1618581 RepID=A0A0G1QKE4_9BACT|nr:MAG: YqeY family protein [Candidatus Woesebacteria bacterium GW2011_GWB1_45_5]
MKARDEVRTSTLRLLSSAFNYEKIEKQHELTEEEELGVIRKQAKQRKDSIDAYKKAGAEDRAAKEGAELKILQEFLPPEMDESELIKLVEDAISQTGAKSMADMGKVIGMVKSKAPSAEGGKIAELTKRRLS